MLCHNCNAEIPDSAILCDACGAVVKSAPDNTQNDANVRCHRTNRRRFFAFCAAVLLLVVGVAGILADNGPAAVAKRYVKAYAEGDLKKVLSLSAGDMRQMLEAEMSDTDREQFFSRSEQAAAQMGLDITIENFGQCYRAIHSTVQESNAQTYGEGCTITVEVQETENMSVKEFNILRAYYSADGYAAYMDVDQLKIGKHVSVLVTITGAKTSQTFEHNVPLVKYKGAWKVIADPGTLL